MKPYDIAMQLRSMVAYNLDEDDQRYTDNEILEEVRKLVVSLPQDDSIRPTLAVYEHASYLTLPHLRLLHEVVEGWLDIHA